MWERNPRVSFGQKLQQFIEPAIYMRYKLHKVDRFVSMPQFQ